MEDYTDIGPIEGKVKGSNGLDHDFSLTQGQSVDGATEGRRRERAATGTAAAVERIAREAGAELSCEPGQRQTALEYGISVLDEPRDWNDDTRDALLKRMNEDHAVVSIGSHVRYLHRAVSAAGQPELRFLKAEDMEALYAAVVVQQRDGKRATAFSVWRKWPGRQQYDGVGMFPPPTVAPKGYLNLWTGFALAPRKGDWSLFREHIRKVICGGDEELFAWVMDWLAHLVQKPGEKPGSALVLKSAAKGSGKTVLNTFLKRLLGGHAISVSKSEHIVGRFNGHLARTILLGVEEAFWAGNKAATGALKNLITETTLAVELKGVDAFDATNYTRLIFTSNEDWAVPVGIDERRFLVLEVNNPNANKREYFDPIFDQMDDGGLAAMLHELLGREIRSNLRQPPETAALVGQREHSMEGIERWVWTVARGGELYDHEAGQPIVLKENDTTIIPRAVVIGSAKKALNQYEGRNVDTSLGELLGRLGIVKSREGHGQRRHTYELPPLMVLRRSVETELKVPCRSDDYEKPVIGREGARPRRFAPEPAFPGEMRARLNGLAARLDAVRPALAAAPA